MQIFDKPVNIKSMLHVLVILAILYSLYLTSHYSYLLFHSLIEIFTIVVACGIFMTVWNSREFLENNYFIFVGIAYLFIAFIDTIHMLSFRGMGVFANYGNNTSMQLWISARYIQGLSLLFAPVFCSRKVKVTYLFNFYSLITLLIFASIFYWRNFPVCFVEGRGATVFKEISEYIISAVLLFSIIFLVRKKRFFNPLVLKFLVSSIVLNIFCELSFNFHYDINGHASVNVLVFKFLSFYLIYKALIETGLSKPFEFLFKRLQDREIELKKEAQRVQNYLDVANVIMLVIDYTQKITLMNELGCKLLGYSQKEVVGKNWFNSFLPAKDRETVREVFERLMQGETKNVEYFENNVLKKNGEKLLIAWHNTMMRDPDGRIIGTLSSGVDITERRKIEDELKESEIKYRTLAQTLPAATYIGVATDPGAKFYISPQIVQILGFPVDEINTNRAWSNLVHPDDLEYASRAIEECKINHVPLKIEYRMRTRDGRFVWVYDSARAVQYKPAGEFYLHGIILDISERKRAEEILKMDKENIERLVNERTKELLNVQAELEKSKRLSDIGALAAIVAHELRNPLGVIKMAMFNIKQKVKNPDIDSHINNVEIKISESNQIINNLLFYSRIKKPVFEKVNLNKIIVDCIDASKKQFPDKDVLIRMESKAKNDIYLEADLVQMEELFCNVLNNAFDAISENNGAIEVCIGPENETDVNIQIKDSGAGMDDAVLNKIFEPFFTTKTKGTGLGLIVCKQIVTLHNGTISIDSKKGSGTNVSIALPLNKNHTKK